MTGEARAVVPDLNTERANPAFRCNFDEAGTGAGRDSVANCILDDRLQDEVWHLRSKRLLRHINACNQTVLKTDAFDFQVTTEESHFLFERDFLRTGVFKSERQKVDKARDHIAGE